MPDRITSLADLRRDYQRGELDESSVAADPIAQFSTWFTEAQAGQLLEPNAMTVATVSNEGQPSARIVLLKGFGPDGFRFYTNYDSQKGQELAANDRVALLFYWGELERQVRIEGSVRKLSREESGAYFHARPRSSQISALASRQSKVIAGRAAMDDDFSRAEAEVGDGEVPLPEDWGGYLVVPSRFEFWQGRQSRRHDRVAYLATADGQWVISRLAP